MKTIVMLYQTIRPEILKPVHEALITAIDAHDFGYVAKKTAADLKRLGLPATAEFLDRGILTLKQYYAVAILDPLNMHAVSPVADDFWHSHVLFTKKYEMFCSQTAGYFMHHEPLDHDNAPEVANVQRVYQYTQECLARFFWHIDSEFWPQTLTNEQLICVHFNSTIHTMTERAVLPYLEDMQPEAVFARE